MAEFKIDGVPYYSQRDNRIEGGISCFPSSLAMCMAYCFQLNGTTQEIIGADPSVQLEDYINMALEDSETTAWMKKNTTRIGNWIWNYKRRTVYHIEEYIFNRFMNEQGYKATFKECMQYSAVCEKMEETGLPMVIGGDFSSISKVRGHMNAMVGYNSTGVREVIVNDPFGNALKGFTPPAEGIRYPLKFFIKDKKEGMNVLCIEQLQEE